MLANRFAWVLPLLLLTTSCRHAGAALGAGILAGWAISRATERPPPPETVYVDRVVVVHDTAPAAAAPAEPPPPAPPPARPFDATRAKIALERAEVATCRAQGVPRGYVHARVSFGNVGNVSRIVVDAPAGLPPDAVTCVGQEIATATAPPFDGDSAPTLGVSWFVP